MKHALVTPLVAAFSLCVVVLASPLWTPASGAPKDLLTALEGRHHDSFNDRARAGNIDLVSFGATDTEMWTWSDTVSGGVDRGRRVWDQAKLVVLHGSSLGLSRPVTIVSGDQLIGDRQAEFVANYARLIAEIRARQPQAKILLLPPFPRGRSRREEWRTIADANAVAYRRLADDSTVFYANFGDRFFLPDGSHNQEMWTIPGPPNAGLHEPGFKVWADALSRGSIVSYGESTLSVREALIERHFW